LILSKKNTHSFSYSISFFIIFVFYGGNMKQVSSKKWQAVKLIAVFILLTIVFATAGYLLFSYQKKSITRDKHDELAAISQLKVDQIVNWRNERLGDANSIFYSNSLTNHIKQYLGGINRNQNYREAFNWLTVIQKNYDYSSFLIEDTNLNPVIKSLSADHLYEFGNKIAREAIKKKTIIFSDIHTNSILGRHLDLVIPLYSSPENRKGLTALLFFRIDPSKFLFPLIQTWPTPSKSSETLLVRREGDSIVFLNELRHRKNTALRLKFSITDTLLPATKAALGITGITEGIDYRGVKVLADIKKVPGTSWFIVAKADMDEIYRPVRILSYGILGFTVLFVLIAALIIYLIWKRQVYKLELERQALTQHFDYIVKYANDIVLLSDEKLNIVECNDSAVRYYGYTRQELIGKNLASLRSESTRRQLQDIVKEIRQNNSALYETVHQRKDGTTFQVEFNSRLIKIEGKTYHQSIGRDLTERKRVEEELKKSEEQLKLKLDTILNPDVDISDIELKNIIAVDELQSILNDLAPVTNMVTAILDLKGNIIESAGWQKICKNFHRMNPESAKSCTESDLHLSGKLKPGESREYRCKNNLWDIVTPLYIGDKLFGNIFTGQFFYDDDVVDESLFINQAKKYGFNVEDYMREFRQIPRFSRERVMLFMSFLVKFTSLISRLSLSNIQLAKEISERKLAEGALKESEEKYRSLFNEMIEGFALHEIICNAKGIPVDYRFLLINPSFEKLTGLRAEEAIGKTVLQVLPGTEPYWIEAYGKVALTGKPVTFENYSKDLDQYYRVVAFSHQKGQFAVLFEDVTERRRAEEALKESEEKYRLMVDVSPDAVVIQSEGKILFANTGTLSILGAEHFDQIKDIPAVEFIHPDLRAVSLQRLSKIEQTGEKPTFIESKFVKLNKEIVDVEIISIPIVFKGKKAFQTIARDITYRKKAEEKIQLLNSRLHQLIQAIKQLAFARDLQTIQDIVKTSARALTGADGVTFVYREDNYCYYADEDAIGPLWKGQKFPIEQCISGWAMLNNKQVVIEDIYSDARIPADAYRSTFVKSLAMVPIATIEPIGAIGNYWAKHYIASEMEVNLLQTLADAAARAIENVKLYDELEHRVAQRTHQLETANKELEAFSYSVSHDLRAPLRGIDGWSLALQEDYEHLLDDQAKIYLGRVRSETQRMGQLIDDILKLSRVTRSELRLMNVDLTALANTISQRLKDANPNRKLDFVIQSGLSITGDSQLLEIALTNLLDNACKFTKRQTVAKIEFGTALIDDKLTYFIRDNGIGFDMKYASKLFGAFQRMHKQSEFPGTGIGLATVQRIIRRHGGKIWAESQVDEGSTFYFTINEERKK
jgi:PAS domain S-box-containing protein